MAGYKVTFQPTAEEDIEASVEYYDTIRPGLSDQFLSEVFDARDKLSASPQLYGYLNNEPLIRFIRLEKLPYNVIYEIVGQEVFVYSVRNTHRDSFI